MLAQIRLAEAAAHDAAGLLPRRGLLQFWYDLDEQPWGFDPKHRDGFRVTFVEDEHAAVPTAEPASLEWRMRQCTLSFGRGLSLPHDVWNELQELEGFDPLVEELSNGAVAMHQMLGHAFVIQNPMEEECQYVSHGLYLGDGYPPEDVRSRLAPGVADWILLMQIDSDEEGPSWMWGDSGILYYWIRRQDLAARRFDRCWVMLQCC